MEMFLDWTAFYNVVKATAQCIGCLLYIYFITFDLPVVSVGVQCTKYRGVFQGLRIFFHFYSEQEYSALTDYSFQ